MSSKTGMSQAYIKNAAGHVLAGQRGRSHRGPPAQNTNVGPTNFSITNELGNDSYPIAGFSWGDPSDLGL